MKIQIYKNLDNITHNDKYYGGYRIVDSNKYKNLLEVPSKYTDLFYYLDGDYKNYRLLDEFELIKDIDNDIKSIKYKNNKIKFILKKGCF